MSPITPASVTSPDTDDLETRWQNALRYYRERSPVVFYSDCHFWEKHAFVQQSLARVLTSHGVRVEWLDGAGWRPYRPTFYWNSPLLKVSQLPRFPGRRFSLVQHLSERMEAWCLTRRLNGGRRPILWIEAGIAEKVAERLPYVDVFSVFDDPYRHDVNDTLCRKASVVTCQNGFAAGLMAASPKVKRLLPPVDLFPSVFHETVQPILPVDFPKVRMGYVGSIFSTGFDLDLFEALVRLAPDIGFVLAGRVDTASEKRIKMLGVHRNFHYIPWVPRDGIGSIWKLLHVTLLLYRPCREQDGAFPTKILESLFFGIPCVATSVPKTGDLEGIFPRTANPKELLSSARTLLSFDRAELSALYDSFSHQMNPKRHLTQVAEWLQMPR